MNLFGEAISAASVRRSIIHERKNSANCQSYRRLDYRGAGIGVEGTNRNRAGRCGGGAACMEALARLGTGGGLQTNARLAARTCGPARRRIDLADRAADRLQPVR